MKLINSLSSLCVAGLTVFATGCSSNDDEPGKINRDLPFGRYSIKGNVSAADSGLPLEAEMRISIPTDPSGVKSIQTNKTEDDGKYYFLMRPTCMRRSRWCVYRKTLHTIRIRLW